MKYLYTLPLLALFLPASVLAQNYLPATPTPHNLGEAAGLYAGAIAHLQAVKSSACGYAIKRSIPTVSQAIRNDIAPLFHPAKRIEVTKLLDDISQDMQRQGEGTLAAMYNYYTQQEGLDHNTACGFVAGSALSMRKLAHEAMTRMAAEPDWEKGIITHPPR